MPFMVIWKPATDTVTTRALKCKTLGGILRCRLTNALSRQLALLAEPKNPLDSTMSTSSGFFVHTMKHCYATDLYTTEVQALSITHARISLPHACNHERNIRTENEPVSRIKMADYSELVSMGML